MRIEIKTDSPLKDPDIRALFIIRHALDNEGTPGMIKANLTFIADRYGFQLTPKARDSQ